MKKDNKQGIYELNQSLYDEFFVDEKGEATFHPSYVVFADLLGTRKLIMDADGPEGLKILRGITTALREADTHIDDAGYGSMTRYFSDCVSIVTPVRDHLSDPWFESSFGFTVPKLVIWQMDMTRRGYPIRGGVAFGMVYADAVSLFGKAHLDAYDLESQRAKFPRIIVDELVIEIATEQLKSYAKDFFTPHEDELLVDVDEEVFLHYLTSIVAEDLFEDNTAFAENILKQHRDLIVSRLADPSLASVRDKYEWMREYHDWFCMTESRFRFDPKQYAIGGSFPSYGNFRDWVNAKEEDD